MNKAAVVAALGLCLVATMCQNAEQAKQERQERLQRQLKATEHLYRNWRPSAPTYEELRDDVIGEQDRTGHSSS